MGDDFKADGMRHEPRSGYLTVTIFDMANMRHQHEIDGRVLDQCVVSYLRHRDEGYRIPVTLGLGPDAPVIGGVTELRREGDRLVADLDLAVGGDFMLRFGSLECVQLVRRDEAMPRLVRKEGGA